MTRSIRTRAVSVFEMFCSDPCSSWAWAHLVEVYGGNGRSGHGRVARRVWQRFARPDGQLLLLPQRHHLLSDCRHIGGYACYHSAQKNKSKTLKLAKLIEKHKHFPPVIYWWSCACYGIHSVKVEVAKRNKFTVRSEYNLNPPRHPVRLTQVS